MDTFAVLGKHIRGHSIFFLLYTLMRPFWCAISPVLLGFVTSRRHLNCRALSIMKLVGLLSSSVFRISYIPVLMFHGFFDREGKNYFSNYMSINRTQKPSLRFFPNVDKHTLSCPSTLSVFIFCLTKSWSAIVDSFGLETGNSWQAAVWGVIPHIASSLQQQWFLLGLFQTERGQRMGVIGLTTQSSHLPLPHWGQ